MYTPEEVQAQESAMFSEARKIVKEYTREADPKDTALGIAIVLEERGYVQDGFDACLASGVAEEVANEAHGLPVPA